MTLNDIKNVCKKHGIKIKHQWLIYNNDLIGQIEEMSGDYSVFLEYCHDILDTPELFIKAFNNKIESKKRFAIMKKKILMEKDFE